MTRSALKAIYAGIVGFLLFIGLIIFACHVGNQARLKEMKVCVDSGKSYVQNNNGNYVCQ